MEKYYKKTFVIIFTILSLSLLFYSFVEGTSFIAKYINTLFSLSMLVVIIGGMLFVIERGFFNVTKYGLKKLTKKKKTDELLEEEDTQDTKDVLYERQRFSITIPFLVSGILLSVLTTIISFLI